MRRFWLVLLLLVAAGGYGEADGYPGSLAVSVVDAAGAPLPRGRVSLTLMAKGDSVGYWHLLIRAGKATFPGPLIEVLAAKHRVDRYIVEVYAAQDAEGHPIDLAPKRIELENVTAEALPVTLTPGLSITGTVALESGALVTQGIVVARPSRYDAVTGLPRPGDVGVHAWMALDARGSFSLRGLDRRAYDLWLVDPETKDAASPAPLVAHGGDVSVRFTKSPVKSVRIRVMDPAGNPVPKASIQVYPSGDQASSHMDTTDADGRLELKGLAPNQTYTLQIHGPRNRDDLTDLRDDAWMPVDGVVALKRGWVLKGVAVDEHDHAVRAALHLRETGGGGIKMVTDEAGVFEFRELPYEPVELAATPTIDGDLPPWEEASSYRWMKVEPGAPPVRVPVQVPTSPK